MRNNAFITLQTVRIAQSTSIERSSWTTCTRGRSSGGTASRYWTEVRGDVMLLYPGAEISHYYRMYLSQRGEMIPEDSIQQLLETKRAGMKPEAYTSLMSSFCSCVPKTKVVPILYRLCKKVANLESFTVTFKAYNATAGPLKSLSLQFDDKKDMAFWRMLNEAPEVYQKTLSDFSVISHVGHGATSEVYQVRDRFSQENLAMKALSKSGVFPHHDAVRRVIDERIVNARMRKHPYILEMKHAFETPGTLYVAREFCSRGDLFHHLRKTSGVVPEGKARMIAAEVLLALEALHDQGIWYRDLKPENVMIADDGHVKLGDFGASRITDPTRPVPQSKSAVGTVEYLAPEMVRAQYYNRAVDLWAFGIFLCELLNGRTPFESDSERVTFENIKHSALILPLTMSADCRDLVRELVQRNPTKRLGAGLQGWEEVKAHPWFAGINWETLLLCPAETGTFERFARTQEEEGPEHCEDECAPRPADWSRKMAVMNYAQDLKRDYQYTEVVRAGSTCTSSMTSDSDAPSTHIPKHPLWTRRNTRRMLGAYTCPERKDSSPPLVLQSQAPLGLLDVRDGRISYVSIDTAGDPPLESGHPRNRTGTRWKGMWRQLGSRLRFWRRR